MSDNELIDAKISASESRTEAKLARMECHIDSKFAKLDGRLDLFMEKMSSTQAAAQRAEEASNRAETAARNVRWNIAFAALSVVGVLYAAWAIWAQGVEVVAGLLGPK